MKRSPTGDLLAITQHEENSYFWKSDLTECITFPDEKLRLEVLLMVDWWNKLFHTEFEIWWNLLKNIHYKKRGNNVLTTSQILTIIGLLLEFISVLIPVWYIFLPKKERYYRDLEKRGRTISTILDEYKKDMILLLILLGLGLLLQGIAVFV